MENPCLEGFRVPWFMEEIRSGVRVVEDTDESLPIKGGRGEVFSQRFLQGLL